jgi:hypothetical protein
VSDTPQPHRLQEGEVVAPFEGTVGIEYSLARATDASRFASAGAGLVGTADDVMAVLEALRDVQRSGLLPPALAAEMASPQVGEQGRRNRPAGASGWALRCCAMPPPAARRSAKAPGAGAVLMGTAGSSIRRVG